MYIYMYVYTHTPIHLQYTRPCPYYRCTAARHETHHGHVLRHAIEHRLLRTSPGNDPSTSPALAPPSFTGPRRSRFFLSPRLFSSSPFFSRLSCVWLLYSPSLSDTLLFRILRVIGSKINRSKVIFLSRSFPLVPRERSVSCLFSFFSRYTFPFFFASLSYFSFSLISQSRSTNSRRTRMVERSIDGNWSAMYSTIGEMNRTCRRCELKLKVYHWILGEIFANRWRTCSTKL